MKVAIVHEWLVNFRGSEKVLLEIARIFPEAVIYASVLDRSQLPEELEQRDIRTTFINRLPFARKWYQKYLPLMPCAYESLDLRGYDLIISSSHACAKGVIPPAESKHICYCYTPMRYAWSGYHDYQRTIKSKVGRWLMSFMMHRLRHWDVTSSMRVDEFVACSSSVQRRIEKYYRRNSAVIHPPVEFRPPSTSASNGTGKVTELLATLHGQSFYLSLGRLVGYKRVDLAVAACKRLQRPLVVAGSGPELNRLKAMAGPLTYFVENFTDEESAQLFQSCRGFLFPGEEDFGITMVEAQNFGKPVIAFRKGGSRDIVLDSKTGILFEEQTVESLIQGITSYEQHGDFDAEFIKKWASQFSPPNFRSELEGLIKSALDGGLT